MNEKEDALGMLNEGAMGPKVLANHGRARWKANGC
jgi:hypothetical protein